MKFYGFTKKWARKAAKLEAGFNVSAGVPDHKGTVTSCDGPYVVITNDDPNAPNHLKVFNLRMMECKGKIAVGVKGTIEYVTTPTSGLHYFTADE